MGTLFASRFVLALDGPPMNLIWLGHSAFRIELGAAVILIDPFLSGNPKFTGDAAKAAAGATHFAHPRP
jgi:L-ascorbate metabolism protein UlaG (beta-lactamase superfamily)